MAISLKFRHVDPVALEGLDSADNPIVSVDYYNNILSRFYDHVWIFTDSKDRPSSRKSFCWPDACGPNRTAAKQLVYLRLTHGSPVGTSAALRMCRTAASLAVFCANQGIELTALYRHPHLVIDFVQLDATVATKATVVSLARLALALRDTLGWKFLEADQIAALGNISTLESYQYPVIPRRIRGEMDDVAHAVLSGYLAVADQFDEVCAIWVHASDKKRKTTARWEHLLSQRPLLAAEYSKWSGEALDRTRWYVSLVRTAASWVIAGGSCARRAEILSLRRGCLNRELVDEHLAYLLSAATTKTQLNLNAIWVVSPKVELAIQALERLLEWHERTHRNAPNLTDFLFQTFDFNGGRPLAPSQTPKGKPNYGEPINAIDFGRLMSFADMRITDDDWAEAKRLTPTLDEEKFAVGRNWVPSPHQLRRTVLVYAAASGLVSQDSLAFQAKHQTWKMTSYYCQHYWHLANTDPDNKLVVGTRESDAVEFTEIYADAYNRARSEAMDEDRLFSPYGRDHKRSVIRDTPLLSLEEIRTGLAHAVLKRNTLGICAQADFCEWQKAITVRGCMTKADGDVCAKAIIDADRVGEIRALQEDLTCQLETLHARDTFAREQVEADIAATAQAIALIEQHSRGQHA
jgi:hypothetical protein